MQPSLMVMPDKMEFVPVPRMTEVWTTAAGPVELSLPLPHHLSVAELTEMVAWLGAVGKKLHRLREETRGIVPIVQPFTEEKERQLRRELEKALGLGDPPDRLKQKADGSDIKHGYYRSQDGRVRRVTHVYSDGVGVFVIAKYEDNGHAEHLPLVVWRTWAADTTFTGDTPF